MSSAGILVDYSWKNMKQLDNIIREIEDLGLSEATLNIAKKELREDQNAREQCLLQLRNWILKNEDVQNVRLDSHFLLRFLRVKKFSVPLAQQNLLKYLNFKRTFPDVVSKLDYMSTSQMDILSKGYLFVSPVRDPQGRRVVIVNVGQLNPKLHTSADMAKAHFIAYETLLADPENQVRGIVHIADISGMTTSHVTFWNPSDFGRIIKWGEQSVPVRHKEIHIVNLPQSLKWLLDFIKNRMSPKMKDRFFTHVSMSELSKRIDNSVLPLEMGGTIPTKDMIDSWRKELAAKRELLLTLDKMKILSDRGIVTRNDRNNNSSDNKQIESLPGSFRKLEFD